ncbi:Spy/CpxP family protein refolding chaperone [Devosia sp. XK-2]|uniref:Spy/CpxP family protein refolding chaperone n=1 Tax=Devosia sp. XK-2 TaxID=3126689 RepID=UPI0030D1B7A2
MKTISTTAIVALIAASIGLGALAPAMAQNAGAGAGPAAQKQPMGPADGTERGFRNGPGMRQGGGERGLFNIERGAEAIEIAAVRLSHAIDLTDEQTVLLEALKSDALAAAAAFDAATEGLRPARPAAGDTAERPDISERFDNRIAIETARLAALEAVQPAFTAFFDSLTDDQKAELAAQHGDRMVGMGKHQGGFGQHDGQRPMGQGNR